MGLRTEFTNDVQILFKGEYSKDGTGAIQSNCGGNYQVSSWLALNKASSFFPCFDHPNLRASFKIEIIKPKDWEFIGNTKVSDGPTKLDYFIDHNEDNETFGKILSYVGEFDGKLEDYDVTHYQNTK